MPSFSKVASATEVASCFVPFDLAAKAVQGAVSSLHMSSTEAVDCGAGDAARIAVAVVGVP